MLVLTRSPSQEIRIGHDIVVRVLDVKGDRVRLGIDAPTEVSVHREEIYLEIARTNEEAAQVQPPDLAAVIGIARGGAGTPEVESVLRNPASGSSEQEENHGT